MKHLAAALAFWLAAFPAFAAKPARIKLKELPVDPASRASDPTKTIRVNPFDLPVLPELSREVKVPGEAAKASLPSRQLLVDPKDLAAVPAKVQPLAATDPALKPGQAAALAPAAGSQKFQEGLKAFAENTASLHQSLEGKSGNNSGELSSLSKKPFDGPNPEPAAAQADAEKPREPPILRLEDFFNPAEIERVKAEQSGTFFPEKTRQGRKVVVKFAQGESEASIQHQAWTLLQKASPEIRRHVKVPALLGLIRLDGGNTLIVMERIQGVNRSILPSIRVLIRAALRNERPVPALPPEAGQGLYTIEDFMGSRARTDGRGWRAFKAFVNILHDHDIVHDDMSWENGNVLVKVGKSGSSVFHLFDFGIARRGRAQIQETAGEIDATFTDPETGEEKVIRTDAMTAEKIWLDETERKLIRNAIIPAPGRPREPKP